MFVITVSVGTDKWKDNPAQAAGNHDRDNGDDKDRAEGMNPFLHSKTNQIQDGGHAAKKHMHRMGILGGFFNDARDQKSGYDSDGGKRQNDAGMFDDADMHSHV